MVMISSSAAPENLELAALRRLSRLAPVDQAALAAALGEQRTVRVHRDLIREGQEIVEPRLIVAGWAARSRILPDGRRQFLSFLLPGDLIGMCRQPRPLAVATVVALTDVVYCVAPPRDAIPHLTDAYATSGAIEEAHLLGHILRLGRLNAQERIGDLFLELHERLDLAGLVSRDGFEMPLTQEMLADALGLTAVHVNRMVQQMRRDNDVKWKNGRLTLVDPVALTRKIGRASIRVSLDAPAG